MSSIDKYGRALRKLNPKTYSLKQADKDLNKVNGMILSKVAKYVILQNERGTLFQSMMKFANTKTQIQNALRYKYNHTASAKTRGRINGMLKK